MSFQDIPLKKLTPSPSNYRRSFSAAALEELTASVKSKGVLQPILVRPLNGKQKGSFEIVAGHRRFTAAKAAGLKSIPAMVRELSDEDALECQVIENHHKEDVNLMEEAEGFKRLLDMGKHTPETLAAKIDCSITYVLGRVRLMDLDEKVRDAIADGTIGPGHAVLFTRLKNTMDQKALLKEILDDDMSVRAAKDFIRHNLSLSLKDAPFDASSCGTCPSRSRNQTVLFDDLKKTDECTDRDCYLAKTRDQFKALLDVKKAEGFKVYTDAKKIEKLLEDRGSTRIAATSKEENYYRTYPLEYKKECVECTEHHAYFMLEDKLYGRQEITFGEICLDRPCLTAMQKTKSKVTTAAEPQEKGPNPYKIKEAARECRDRFLLSTLPEKLNGYIVKKLLILQLYRTRGFLTQPAFLTAILGESVPHHECDEVVYRKISEKFPVPHPHECGTALTAAVSKALLLTLGRDLCDTLLAAAPEAGVVMSRDFAIDEAWLKGKTKEDLSALVTELGLPVKVKASSKKGDLIASILAEDLKGKVPKEIAEGCNLDTKDDDEYVSEPVGDWCGDCGEEGEDCTCTCGPDLSLSGDPPNGNGEDEYPAAPESKEETSPFSKGGPRGIITDPSESETPSPLMGEGKGEGEEHDPTMPSPTKTKRKPRARA